MSATICLAVDTLGYPEGGGHQWVYLNWALSLRALGFRVFWLEGADPLTPVATTQAQLAALRERLERYGLAGDLVLASRTDEPLPAGADAGCLPLDAATGADLLLSLRYGMPAAQVARFQRAALVDIDPGLLQSWLTQGLIRVARYRVYFTIGETVGQPGARFRNAGLEWQHVPPCVALDAWPVHAAAPDAPFTTVTHWYADEWMEDEDGVYANDKRTGFLPFLDLPRHTRQPLELALCLGDDAVERAALLARGWRVRESSDVSSTPWAYQAYLQGSRGEFSCVKPSCVRLQNAWISDRTICYLASGKPAVVQHTGPSRFLPGDAGLFRFHTLPEAAACIEKAAAEYDRQSRLARALAEEYFDGRKVVARVLERVM